MNTNKKEPVWRLETKDKSGMIVYKDVKLVDATISQLLEWSSLCDSILNGDDHHAGKYKRQKKIRSYFDKVMLENNIRKLCALNKTSKNELFIDISASPFSYGDITDKYKMSDIENACIGKLGSITDRILPLKYLFAMGCNSVDPIEECRKRLGLKDNDERLKYNKDGKPLTTYILLLQCYGCDITEFPTSAFDNLLYAFTQYLYNINTEINRWKILKGCIEMEINRR